MTVTYKKKIFPTTWREHYVMPTYEITFDTSSPYITNTITPFDVLKDTQAVWDNAIQTRVVVGGNPYYMELSDDVAAITGRAANNIAMVSGVPITITNDTEFVPTVTHTVIHRDTQGPCPNGYHIGTQTEWNAVLSALTTLGVANETDTMTYLKMPATYYLNRSNGSKNTSYGPVKFWTSTMTNNTTAYIFHINENHVLNVLSDKPGNAFSIRPFTDTPVVPDSRWTLITTGIYWSSTLGLISILNGSDWITMSDKNLGATNVGDNGLYYQFGNNHGFEENPSVYRTTKVSNTQGYGPGNYYNDATYTRCSKGNGWFTDTNNNIWGGVTNGTWTDPV